MRCTISRIGVLYHIYVSLNTKNATLLHSLTIFRFLRTSCIGYHQTKTRKEVLYKWFGVRHVYCMCMFSYIYIFQPAIRNTRCSKFVPTFVYSYHLIIAKANEMNFSIEWHQILWFENYVLSLSKSLYIRLIFIFMRIDS